MKPRTLHVYGSTKLESELCPRCGYRAFIVKGRMSCCGTEAPKREWEALKIEVDTSNNKRRGPSPKLRRLILKEQNNCCFYCGDRFGDIRIIDGVPTVVQLHWDHFVPFSYNHNNHQFVAACAECNTTKGAHHYCDIEEAKLQLQLKIYERKTPVVTPKAVQTVRHKFPPEASLAYLL